VAQDELNLPPGFVRHQAITDAEITWVLRLHGQGRGRNDIMRETGLAAKTVSETCKAFGLTFDRTKVRAATAARVADAKQMRAELQVRYLEEAGALLDDIRSPTKVFNFGGKDNTYNSVDVEQPPVVDQLKLMQAATIATDRALRLAEHDAGDGAEEGRSLIGALAERLGVRGPTAPPAQPVPAAGDSA
jgi:hypothetical protein